MIKWNIPVTEPSKRRTCGSSDASEKEALISDLGEMWCLLFEQLLVLHDSSRWNSILGALQISHGTVGLHPTLNGSLYKQLPGCELYLSVLHEKLEEITDDAPAEEEYVFQVQLVKEALTSSFERVNGNGSVRKILDLYPLQFQLLAEPDQPPLIDTVLC